jgi:hypothetical protein
LQSSSTTGHARMDAALTTIQHMNAVKQQLEIERRSEPA